MCGIFFSLSRRSFVSPESGTEQLLRNRGPDSLGRQQLLLPTRRNFDETPSSQSYATFVSTVLSLRGPSLVEQPLKDEDSGSILCWNGEAWSIGGQTASGNDSQFMFDALLRASEIEISANRDCALEGVAQFFSSVCGPFAFVFHDARNHFIFFGRDCLGRRSLLKKTTFFDEFILSSVCDNATGNQWTEVEADGIHVIDLKTSSSNSPLRTIHIPHQRLGDAMGAPRLTVPFPTLNQAIDTSTKPSYLETLHELDASLRRSLVLRVQHVREASNLIDTYASDTEARVAILFSGGLDCTILARLMHDLLPLDQSIDLLNVAFENPRIHKDLRLDDSPYEMCPDRVTGRSSHAELLRVCPGRTWRFVEINVPYSQTIAHRTRTLTLMHPHNTEMDLSISYALYFASKGRGVVYDQAGVSMPYITPARVLVSGLGADELFGGYQRHAVAFSRQGYSGLLEELELDFNRLGKRNLGRDDRVISDSGREVRFPYLDEDFVAFALELPVSAKCDFANPRLETSNDPAQFLEPSKRMLRLLAWQLGMKHVAAEKKRAIQFGSRTAKMETGKTKGTQALT